VPSRPGATRGLGVASGLLELGLVSELLRRPALLPRAWPLAEQIARHHALLLRYTRVLFTQPLKKQLVDYLGYGLALEGLSVVGRTVTPGAWRASGSPGPPSGRQVVEAERVVAEDLPARLGGQGASRSRSSRTTPTDDPRRPYARCRPARLIRGRCSGATSR